MGILGNPNEEVGQGKYKLRHGGGAFSCRSDAFCIVYSTKHIPEDGGHVAWGHTIVSVSVSGRCCNERVRVNYVFEYDLQKGITGLTWILFIPSRVELHDTLMYFPLFEL